MRVTSERYESLRTNGESSTAVQAFHETGPHAALPPSAGTVTHVSVARYAHHNGRAKVVCFGPGPNGSPRRRVFDNAKDH
jgi:hypothetical protein